MGGLLDFHFMQNAYAAGTLVALLAGTAGYFVVLRGQSFAAHMLSQVGFPGAAAGALLHVSPVLGLLVFCAAGALAVGGLARDVDAGDRTQSAAIGSILALALGLGLLFVRLHGGGTQLIYSFLFGAILGITDADVQVTAAVAIAGLAFLAAIGRPLVFASVDPDVADARGVPVRALAMAFLLILAISVAVTVQIVGTLLVFALLVAPGAAALQVTARPVAGVAISVAVAVAVTWAGLALAYFTDLPVGFLVTTLALGAYAAARTARVLVPA